MYVLYLHESTNIKIRGLLFSLGVIAELFVVFYIVFLGPSSYIGFTKGTMHWTGFFLVSPYNYCQASCLQS